MENNHYNLNRKIINSEQQKKSGQEKFKQGDKDIGKGVAMPVSSYKPKPSQPKPNSKPKPDSKPKLNSKK